MTRQRRRTKLEMNWMRTDVTEWLLKSGNNPHKAWDAYIKYHLENKMLMDHYIRGIKDFNAVSEELAKEMQQEKEEKEYKEQLKRDKAALTDELKQLTPEQGKALWKENKATVSESDKITLVDMVNMIMNQEYWIEEKHLRLYEKLQMQPA